MKKLLTIIFFLACFSLISAYTYKTIRSYALPVATLENKPIQKIKIKAPILKIKLDVKGHNAFLDAIGHQESGNRYHIVNRYGYMGRYQFGNETLKTLRIKVSKINTPKKKSIHFKYAKDMFKKLNDEKE